MKQWRFASLILVIGPIAAAAVAFLQCYVRGTCSGDCIAVGYDVTSVCWVLALKTWLVTCGALGVAYGVWRYSERRRGQG